MGHHNHNHGKTPRSQTLPSSPTHSSSSSEFEFTISLSPRKSYAKNLSPADDLCPFISLLASPWYALSSSLRLPLPHPLLPPPDTPPTHTPYSPPMVMSSRHSSVTDDDLHMQQTKQFTSSLQINQHKKPNKYFSLSRFSSVFRKETKPTPPTTTTATPSSRADLDIITGSSVKRMSANAKEIFQKYLKKAKPLYEKLSHKMAPISRRMEDTRKENDVISHLLSGNLRIRYPRRRCCVSSCPSSMRSSPSHSGILCHNSVVKGTGICSSTSSNSSSMEELQSEIQGAIAHCKNSMTENK